MTDHSLYDSNPLKSHRVFCVSQHMLIWVNDPYVFEKIICSEPLGAVFYDWN